MPIKSTTDTSLMRKCAVCGLETEILIADLTLGVTLGDLKVSDCIRLPVCVCGAQEQLMRTWDTPPEESVPSTHVKQKGVVNALANKLKELDQVDPGVADDVAAENGNPAHTLPMDGTDVLTE